MQPEILTDGLNNYVNLVGSTVDPTANYHFDADCGTDIADWYAAGGIAKKICSFWAISIGTGIEVTVQVSGKGRNSVKLKEWLEKEYQRIDLLSILIEAEVQCSIAPSAPIVVVTDEPIGSLGTPYQSCGRVDLLQIQNPEFFYPTLSSTSMMSGGVRAVDHRFVSSYSGNYLGGTAHSSRVLPMRSNTLAASEKWHNILERNWGRPLVGSSVVRAAIRYEAAVTIASILIEKKNMLVYGIKGFNEGMSGAGREQFAKQALAQVKALQQASNVLNVALVDLESSKLEAIDRNISGVSDLVEHTRKALLSAVDSIPADFLFGERSHGGLNSGNDDLKRIDNESMQRFNHRWLPLINKLNSILLNSASCPVKGIDPSSISIGRVSANSISPKEKAEVRLALLQGDKLMIDIGAISPSEVRMRQASSVFQEELILNGEAPMIIEQKPVAEPNTRDVGKANKL
jgi:hypothetical protein